MKKNDKIYNLRGFCNMQDDCSKCRLDALTDNCDFDELPDKKIDQLYKIVEKKSIKAQKKIQSQTSSQGS